MKSIIRFFVLVDGGRSVLTPAYAGLENALDLPQASTLYGECHVVCPVKILLPDLLRKLREKHFERGLVSRLPLGPEWTQFRDMPAPPGQTFSEQYRRRQQDRQHGQQ